MRKNTVDDPIADIDEKAYKAETNLSEAELETVFDDFSFYLSSAIKTLEPIGIKFYTVEKQKAYFNYLNRTDYIDLSAEDALVGYVFISAEGKVLKRFNVLTDIDIIDMAKRHFSSGARRQKNMRPHPPLRE